jgi:hypothetical protein
MRVPAPSVVPAMVAPLLPRVYQGWSRPSWARFQIQRHYRCSCLRARVFWPILVPLPRYFALEFHTYIEYLWYMKGSNGLLYLMWLLSCCLCDCLAIHCFISCIVCHFGPPVGLCRSGSRVWAPGARSPAPNTGNMYEPLILSCIL